MKLELKHLAPYLPYGLTGKTKKEIEPWKIVGYKEDSFSITEPTLLCTHSTYKNVINIWSRNIKPILRPLSDLTKEIEHNGEKIMPILELAKVSDNYFKWEFNNESLFHKSVFCKHENGWTYRFSINTNGKKFYSINTTFDGIFTQTNDPHLVMIKLFEMHFDVFGLIDAGLAIDINTLNK